MGKALRFCIGEPTGSHSTSWKIWSHGNDVYLSSRALASDVKVSLHESGLCQFSETSELMAQTGRRNRERHLQRWERRPAYPESGTIHLFRIIIPQTELRVASAEQKPAKELIWYPSPPPGQGAYLELWLTPPLKEPPVKSQFMNDLLGALPFSNGQWVAVTARFLEIKPHDNEQLRQLADRAALRLPPDPRTRGWALTFSNQDVHALVEFAPFSD